MPTPPPPFRSVGDFIRSQRELMSLSMRQLAEMAQVSNPYLSQIERGVYKPSAQVLKGIADALDMSAETLYREAGLLDDSVERPAQSVEDAIRVDPRLTQEGKQALIQVYQGLIAAQAAPTRSAPQPAPAPEDATPRPSAQSARRSAPKPARKAATASSARKPSSATPASKTAAAKSARQTAAKTPSRTTTTHKPKPPKR